MRLVLVPTVLLYSYFLMPIVSCVSTGVLLMIVNGIGQQLSLDNLNSLEKLTTEGDSPVKVMLILSS